MTQDTQRIAAPLAGYAAMMYLAMFADRNTRLAAIKMAEVNRDRPGATAWGALIERAQRDLADTAEQAGALEIKPELQLPIGTHDLYPQDQA